MEQRDDVARHAEMRHHQPDLRAAGIDGSMSDDPFGDLRRSRRVDQRGERAAAGSERALDDEVSLGEEQTLATVIASLRAARQTAFVETEGREPRVRRVVDRDDGDQ